jgi:hypothetical protein
MLCSRVSGGAAVQGTRAGISPGTMKARRVYQHQCGIPGKSQSVAQCCRVRTGQDDTRGESADERVTTTLAIDQGTQQQTSGGPAGEHTRPGEVFAGSRSPLMGKGLKKNLAWLNILQRRGVQGTEKDKTMDQGAAKQLPAARIGMGPVAWESNLRTPWWGVPAVPRE